MVAAQLGHSVEESADTPEGEARRRLVVLGVDRSDVDELLAGYAVEEILQQLDWLPERLPRNPARLIVAAIRGRYEAPILWRPESRSQPEPASVEPDQGNVVELEIPQQTARGQDEQ
jgi:hypothetical protein